MILFGVLALAVSMLLYLLTGETDNDPGAMIPRAHRVRAPARSQGRRTAARVAKDRHS